MKSPRPFLYLLTAMYTAGLIGLNIPQTTSLFRFLTPFNLIASLGILLYFHEDWSRNFNIFIIITFLTGFFIEVLGVKTGLIFGKYQYDTTLGFKTWGVPPVIGVNWLMLVYCVGVSSQRLDSILWSKLQTSTSTIRGFIISIYGAIILTALDYLVEPIAIRQQMWSWFGQMPPLQNYIGWFVVSFVLLYLFYLLVLKPKPSLGITAQSSVGTQTTETAITLTNPIAQWLLILNILFFGIQRLF
jgi:bisanhydrobacterioruberin hydratase